jgi:hypothetical protein
MTMTVFGSSINKLFVWSCHTNYDKELLDIVLWKLHGSTWFNYYIQWALLNGMTVIGIIWWMQSNWLGLNLSQMSLNSRLCIWKYLVIVMIPFMGSVIVLPKVIPLSGVHCCNKVKCHQNPRVWDFCQFLKAYITSRLREPFFWNLTWPFFLVGIYQGLRIFESKCFIFT